MINKTTVVVLYNKPVWYVVSKDDPHNKTIYEVLPKSWLKDFYYVWRLDKDSTWLLLLTNSPELVNEIEHSKKNNIKIYEVRTDKQISSSHAFKLKKWVRITRDWELVKNINSSNYDWIEKDLLSCYDINCRNYNWRFISRILLTYWKNRHIRRMMTAYWYKVKWLHRIKYGKYELWNIKPWKYSLQKIKRTWKKTRTNRSNPLQNKSNTTGKKNEKQ